MKRNTAASVGLGLGIAALAVGCLAAPAQADPTAGEFGTLVGTGSDTTQDVMNGISAAVGGTSGLRIASYDATGGANITVREGGPTLFRPNGSGQGRDVLRVALGQTASYTGTTFSGTPGVYGTEAVGQFDYARSSSGASSADLAGNGVLTYVPFARDAVGYAVSDETALPPLSYGAATDTVDAEGVGPNTLYAIYRGVVDAVVLDADDEFVALVKKSTYETEAGETEHDIHALVPQAGSGTRSFWIGKFGITEAMITDGTVPVKATYGASNTAVQEHDGSALVDDAFAVVPFSIAQWVAQDNGVANDRRHGAVIGDLGGVPATVASGDGVALNPEFITSSATSALTRLVYNIIPSAEADDPTSLTNWAFVGKGSLVCSQKETIAKFGFGLLTATSGSASCGDTSVRAYAPSTPTVEVSAPTVKFGATSTITATVTSNHDKGGSVEFFEGEKSLGKATIASGATKASIKVASRTLGLGTSAVTAVFVPNLAGIADAESEAASVAVSKATSSVRASAKTVSAKKNGAVTVAVTGSTGSSISGKVTVKEGSKTLGSATLKNGKATVKLAKLKKGTHKLVVSYSGTTTVGASSAKVTLKVTK